MSNRRTPVAVRNNNPGCIRRNGRSYARYASLEEGYGALTELLIRRYNHKTAYQIFRVYAPASDGNNPHKYAAGVVKSLRNAGLNVDDSTKLDMNNPQVLRALCLAISHTECGRELDPASLDRALAKTFNSVALSPQTQKQTRPSFWKRMFSRKETAVAAATPQKAAPQATRRSVNNGNSKPYPALVKLYYNKLHTLNAIDRKKTPLRWRQAKQGVIVDINVPRLKDPFENDAVRAMAATEKAILSNAHLPAQQQMQTVFAVAAQSMQDHILANDSRCQEVLTMITGAAMAEIQQRQGKNLSPNETNKIYTSAKALVSNSSIRRNPRLFLAQCQQLLNSNQPKLRKALVQAGAKKVSAENTEELAAQNMNTLKSQTRA